MRLAIADPPYLGRAGVYLPGGKSFPKGLHESARWGMAPATTDGNVDAEVWNQADTHRRLVEQLQAEYDGWVVAMYPDSLRHYLAWAPTARVCAWVQPDAMPTGRVIRSWEPVLLSVPKRPRDVRVTRDALVAVRPEKNSRALVGTKPRAWTRWVLDLMGYDPETDTVDDLFGGSGAVTAEINQGVLL